MMVMRIVIMMIVGVVTGSTIRLQEVAGIIIVIEKFVCVCVCVWKEEKKGEVKEDSEGGKGAGEMRQCN